MQKRCRLAKAATDLLMRPRRIEAKDFATTAQQRYPKGSEKVNCTPAHSLKMHKMLKMNIFFLHDDYLDVKIMSFSVLTFLKFFLKL